MTCRHGEGSICDDKAIRINGMSKADAGRCHGSTLPKGNGQSFGTKGVGRLIGAGQASDQKKSVDLVHVTVAV